MKITCLCENTPFSEKFNFEHGLSLYIETNGKKILFDMGQTDVFCKNAQLLGIDLSDVDTVVLSHGHYDHGGSIKKFLSINTKAKIHLSKFAFGNHYNGIEKYIGLDQSLIDNDRLIFCDDYLKLCEGIELFSQNDAKLVTAINSAGLNVRKGDEFYPDKFIHEQYLKITEGEKSFLISGCSHKGILNIVNWFEPDFLIGGFHLMKQEVDKTNPILIETANQLKKYNTTYYTCHCTGLGQYNILKEIMADQLNYISSGQEIDFK